ncbi:MAG: BASS family bile acid:Na+ symporter, partial [Verrucomicrobiales bacterium]
MISELLEQYTHYHRLVASTQLVLAMFGMGIVTHPRAFLEIALEPKPMIVGILFQLVGIPLLTVAMVYFIELPPEIVVGFFMVAAMPGGSMSNIYTYLGKGNAALSVALTGVMTLLALVTAPLILKMFAAEHIPPEITMPVGTIMREIFVFLLLPLAIGMALGRRLPVRSAMLMSNWTVRASLVVLGILVIGSLGSGSIDFTLYGPRIPLLVFLYCLVIQIISLRGSRHVLKFSLSDSTALGIESTMKNINLSLLIAASLFSLEGDNSNFGAGVLFVLLLYGGISLGVAAVPAITSIRHIKRASRDEDAG